MKTLIYFDYCALIIFLILLISTLMRRKTLNKFYYIFVTMVIFCIIATIADIGAVELGLNGPGNVHLKYFFHSLYLFFHNLLAPTYVLYIYARTGTLYKMRQKKYLSWLFLPPMILVTVLLSVNSFWHIVFYLNENDAYTRGPIFILLYLVAVYYTIYGMIHLFRYRKTIPKKLLIALACLFPFTIIAVIIQFFFKHLLIELFANACGLLFIAMIIQRPEERIDSDTDLDKQSAYIADITHALKLKKKIVIVMINIVNYSSIREMLGYYQTIVLTKLIADKMVELNKNYKLDADIYYFGDGKFRFILSENFDKADLLANAINNFLSETIPLNQMDVHIVPCVCITRCPDDIADIDSLIDFGNELNSKRFYNGEVLYASQLYKKDHFDIKKDIDRIIESALAEHRFSVYYQPIYSVKEGRFQSAEALLRLRDEKYGFISPDIFIKAAEQSGAIHKIGEFVLEEVCKFISSSKFTELGLDYIEINLSAAECMQNNLANRVLATLKKYNVRPDQINLEITETAASYSQKTMLNNMRILDEAGVHFSLDDFGTGYSNMRRVASLPLYLVKLDKSFTDVEENQRLMIVLQNTIKMIKEMNMQIVVEGVETESLAKQFSDLQCEYIQGYYYSRPVPRDEFIQFIEKSIQG